MRTVIFMGLLVIALAINPTLELPEGIPGILAGIFFIAALMDTADFIKKHKK